MKTSRKLSVSNGKLNQLHAAQAGVRDFIQDLLLSEREVKRAYFNLSLYACGFDGVYSATIFLPELGLYSSGALKSMASVGLDKIPCPSVLSEIGTSATEPNIHRLDDSHLYLDISRGDTVVGKLGVRVSPELDEVSLASLKDIAWAAGQFFGRQCLHSEIELSRERVNMHSELNQSILKNQSITRVSTTLAREAAYRFGANCALVYLSKDDSTLSLSGQFGVPRSFLPEDLLASELHPGRNLNMSGVFSIPNSVDLGESPMSMLGEQGLQSIHSTSLLVEGQAIGVLVVGFSSNTNLELPASLMLKEFADAAAICLKNCLNKEELKNFSNNMDQLVDQKVEKFSEVASQASNESKAKSRFIANMSHELRTPLTAIIGYSSVLKDGVYGELNSKQTEALQSIERFGEHLKDLIDEVLNLSRIEAGKETPVPSPVETNSLLKQLYKLMLQQAIAKNIDFTGLPENQKELEGLKLWVDPRHIRQILLNILSNSIKYTKENGRVEVLAERIGDKLKISVKDTGVGISESDLTSLFDRFARADEDYSSNQVGTGIGLALTKQLVEINGGRIEVTSEKDVGSCFSVIVPLEDGLCGSEECDLEEEVESDKSQALEGLNILIVDDNESTCRVLQAIVEQSGGTGFSSYNTKDAREIAETQKIDAALIDLAIPGESGLDLIKDFSSSTKFNSIPLIAVSACVFDKDREAALHAGAERFVGKPFKPSELLSVIREELTNKIVSSGSRHSVVKLDD